LFSCRRSSWADFSTVPFYAARAQPMNSGRSRRQKAGEIDFLPFSFEACRPDLPTVINYALQQSLIPRKIDVEELFDATTRALRS
jgi:hypothetical protein